MEAKWPQLRQQLSQYVPIWCRAKIGNAFRYSPQVVNPKLHIAIYYFSWILHLVASEKRPGLGTCTHQLAVCIPKYNIHEHSAIFAYFYSFTDMFFGSKIPLRWKSIAVCTIAVTKVRRVQGDWNIGKAQTPPLRAEQRFEYMIIHWQTHAKTHAKTIESSIYIGRWTSFKSNIVYICLYNHVRPSENKLWWRRSSASWLLETEPTLRIWASFSRVSLWFQKRHWVFASFAHSGNLRGPAAQLEDCTPHDIRLRGMPSRRSTGSQPNPDRICRFADLPTCWICRSADAGEGEEIESKGSTSCPQGPCGPTTDLPQCFPPPMDLPQLLAWCCPSF